METESRNKVGKISLCAALGGIVGGTLVALLLVMLESLTETDMPFSLCVLMFIGLEVGALVAGIVAWGSPFGKAGFGTSILLLAITTFFIPVSRQVSTSRSANTEHMTVVERTRSSADNQ